jgi:hypothetical protein
VIVKWSHSIAAWGLHPNHFDFLPVFFQDLSLADGLNIFWGPAGIDDQPSKI